MGRYHRDTTPENVKDATIYQVFESPEEYVSYLNSKASNYKMHMSRYSGAEFYGGTWDQAIDQLTHGTDKHVERAQSLIDKMADQHVFASHQPAVESSVTGFMPNVAAAIQGLPLDMYNNALSDEQNITTPIRIYVETLVSAGITIEELVDRGTCVMALALAMNNIRPVELYTICIGKAGTHTGGIVCKIPTKPLDIARAALMLCDPLYYRQLAFGAIREQCKSRETYLQWPWDCVPTHSNHAPLMRALLDMSEEDVFITGGYVTDELMKKNPIQWVKNMIALHQGTANQDYC